MLLLVVAVAAFNIIATLVMVVKEKRADIAILRTLGGSPREMLTIFMTQGSSHRHSSAPSAGVLLSGSSSPPTSGAIVAPASGG